MALNLRPDGFRGIQRTLHPKATVFLGAREAISRTDHMCSHKTIPHKFKRTEIVSSIVSEHNGLKQEINYMKKTKKFTNLRLNNMLLKTTGSRKKSKGIKKILRQTQLEMKQQKFRRCSKSSSRRQGHSNKCYLKK